MEIIDAHAHIYPEKIAAKATSTIGVFYDIEMEMPAGTPERLLQDGRAAGISRFVVHSVATTAHQVRSINDFIKRELDLHPEFIGFITLHQDLSEEEVFAEVDWAVENGFRGIKLHPDFQKFNIDDPCAYPIYECIAGKLPLIIHTGDDRYEYSHPKRMAKVLDLFPKLDCVCAHMGGYRVWEEAYECLGKRRCWVDSSSTTGMLNDDEYVKSLVSRWGTERILFGSDFPMWDHTEELERVSRLGITGDGLEAVMHGNAESLISC